MAGSDDGPVRRGLASISLLRSEIFRGYKALSKLRQTDRLMEAAACIAFCHPGQAKRETES